MMRRLPGLRFEARAPKPDVVLPRMDIAAFVGFAACGPLDTPVAIEDVSQFADIFGPDAPLAWDRQRGARVYSLLGPAVRAFFRGGGRRCWVIRVAGSEAQTTSFTLHGLYSLDQHQPVQLMARSAGSWADRLRVQATLERRPLPETLLDELFGSPPWFAEERAAGTRFTLGQRGAQLGLSQGDLVRIVADEHTLWCVTERNGTVLRVALTTATELLYSPPTPLSCELLTCTLWVWDGPAIPLRVAGLGFSPDHARYLGELPTDTTMFDPSPASKAANVADRSELWRDVASPRFPLAGMGNTGLLLPLDLPLFPDAAQAFVPQVDQRTALERDGLSDFSDRLFLDPGMDETTVFSFAAQAEWLRYQQPTPRLLRGLHAAYEIEEISLIAVPDALHMGWQKDPAPTPTPALASVPPARPAWWPFLACAGPDSPLLEVEVRSTGAVILRWQAASLETAWEIEEARQPDFADANVVWLGSTMHVRLPNHAAGDYFYRVRAQGDTGPSAWSNAVVAEIPANKQTLPRYEHFLPCDTLVLDTPELYPASEPDDGGTLTLCWNQLPDAQQRPGLVMQYVLEEALRPDWLDAHVVSQPRLAAAQGYQCVTLYDRPAGVYYYRVRVMVGEATSDWSNGIMVQIDPPPVWALLEWPQYTAEKQERLATLLAVQRSLLRMCAARGDLFALLALPEALLSDDALQATAWLIGNAKAAIAPLAATEQSALSYGALYHPWTVVRDERGPEPLRAISPDGAICGLYARQALERGAWIAPANQVVPGVAALFPMIPAHRRGALFDAQINQVRQEARGFLTMSADTLSPDALLRPVNVRRLLMLLRRLALRRGADYVFEANSDAFRRLVQREFEATLGYLFSRGAFVGATPAASFRVDVSDLPGDLDAGRLIVELRVAPAQPLAFLTVRLVQIGDRARVLEVR